jgi:DNA-binding transcriptional MerR regulator
MKYSTRQAAKELGLHYTTMHKYLKEKKIPLPEITRIAGVRVRLWSESDLERVRKLLPKIANGRKTRYKKHSTVSTQQSAKAKKKTQARVPAPHKKK